jgi:hypothetical protein
MNLTSGGVTMATQSLQPHVQNPIEHNTKQIDQLIHEVKKLDELLEEKRLVEPTSLTQLKLELNAIQRGE